MQKPRKEEEENALHLAISVDRGIFWCRIRRFQQLEFFLRVPSPPLQQIQHRNISDGEKPYYHNFACELASEVPRPDDYSKVKSEIIWEGKHDLSTDVGKDVIEQTNPFLPHYVDVCRPINGSHGICGQYDSPINVQGLIPDDQEFFDGRNGTEITLSDMLVSVHDADACDIIKDVCIDEGANSPEKILVENVVARKVSSSTIHSMRNGDVSHREESRAGATVIEHDLRSTSLCGSIINFDTDTGEQHPSKGLPDVGAETDNTQYTVDGISKERGLRLLLPSEDCAPDPKLLLPTSCDCSSNYNQFDSVHNADQGTLKTCFEAVPTGFDTPKLIENSYVIKGSADAISEEMLKAYSASSALPSDVIGSSQSNGTKSYTASSLSVDTQEEGHPAYTFVASLNATQSREDIWNMDSSNALGNTTLAEESSTIKAIRSYASLSNRNNGAMEIPHDSLPGHMLEEYSELTAVLSDAPGNNHVSGESHAKGEIELGDRLCDFNPRAAEMVGTKGKGADTDSKNIGNIQNDSLVVAPEVVTTPSLGSAHQNHGDLIFSGPSVSAAPMTSSSPVLYSGSISLRSDSSTTSARSFAFPILQTEWNSSPVKMAKADCAYLRRRRGWRSAVLCCKF